MAETTTLKKEFIKQLQVYGKGYDNYQLQTILPQLITATGIINTTIGSVNIGALTPSQTATVVDTLQEVARVADKAGIDYTNMKKGDLSTLLKGTAQTLITKNVFSDAQIYSLLNKLNEELGDGVFTIFSPLITNGIKVIQNKATSLIGKMLWSDAANMNSDLSNIGDKIAEGGTATTLTPIQDTIEDAVDREERMDGATVSGVTGGKMTYDPLSTVMNKEVKFDWGIMSADGTPEISFTSYLSDSFDSKGKVTTEHVEENSFASYNKLDDGLTGTVTFAMQPSVEKEGWQQTQEILKKLDALKEQATVFSIVTPHSEYEDMTLVSYKYDNIAKETASTLKVTLTCEKIKNVTLESKQAEHKKIKSPKKATNAPNKPAKTEKPKDIKPKQGNTVGAITNQEIPGQINQFDTSGGAQIAEGVIKTTTNEQMKSDKTQIQKRETGK